MTVYEAIEKNLSNCPFCGFKAVVCKKMYGNVPHRYRIQCEHKGCAIRTPWLCYLEDAAEAWNRRAESEVQND